MHAAACHAYRPASLDAAIASRAAAQASSAASADSTDSADAPARTEHHHRHHGERRHPLVAAMTEALRSLMPADTSTADSSEVQDSARAFAHELSDALRGSDGGRRGLRGAHHGYDNLAQRLDRLAGTLEQPAATDSASAASTLNASLSSASLNVTIDQNGTSASLAITTIELQVSQQNAAADASPAPAKESPLLAAFRHLMSALQPDATPAAGADDNSKLAAFLRQLASALRGDADTPAEPAASTGTLVSVAA